MGARDRVRGVVPLQVCRERKTHHLKTHTNKSLLCRTFFLKVRKLKLEGSTNQKETRLTAAGDLGVVLVAGEVVVAAVGKRRGPLGVARRARVHDKLGGFEARVERVDRIRRALIVGQGATRESGRVVSPNILF
jgi:hypothetical protein